MLTALVGTCTWLLGRQRIQAAVEERTTPGIAAGLHASFAGDPAAARNEVAEIIRRHFRTDLGAILDEAPAAR